MKSKLNDKQIANIQKWHKEQTVAEFLKEEMMELDGKKTKASTVVDRLYKLTSTAITDGDKIKAAELILKNMASNDAKTPNVQINNQFNLADWAENLK